MTCALFERLTQYPLTTASIHMETPPALRKFIAHEAAKGYPTQEQIAASLRAGLGIDDVGLDSGVREGATLAVDGRVHPVIGGVKGVGEVGGGFWLGPSVLDHVTPEMSCYTDEIFGPVLSVLRAPTYEAAVQMVNDSPYGNGVAVFTNDGGAARRFVSEAEIGMVGVNVPIPVPMAYYSFGGWKASLFGDTHVHGTEGIHFYTRGKVVTSRWLDPSHGGVNLGFPVNT